MYTIFHYRNCTLVISSFVIFNISLPQGVDTKHFKAHLSHLTSLHNVLEMLIHDTAPDSKVKGLFSFIFTHLSALLNGGRRFRSDIS